MKHTKNLLNTKKNKMTLIFMIFTFSLISFYTSYTGLMSLLGSSSESSIFTVFTMLLVGILQFALVFSINHFYLKDIISKDWVKATMLLVVYIITMTVSVTFSFTFWYESFSAENYAKRSSELQLNVLKDHLLEASHSFLTMKDSLNTLSSYSVVTSSREKVYGGTCGGRAISGEGPLTWVRADDATVTMEYSKEIQQLQKALNLEIEEVSGYLQRFDPKGDVVGFNREVNDRVKRININFLQNSILENLKIMLTQRSGVNRKHISVVSRKTLNTSVESCMDKEFTRGANRVFDKLKALHPIKALHFFNINDRSTLFARTTGVLVAIFNPAYSIKKVEEVTNHKDITYDDIQAVSAGFLIDFLILCIALYAKEPKDDFLFLSVMEDITKGKYSTELLDRINPYLAEIMSGFFIAVPNKIGDEKVENLKQLMLYMQKYKLAEFYVSDMKAENLIPYFSKKLQDSYPNDSFKIYKVDKEKFNETILQNIERGVYRV
jgi:hypothetical protein